MARGFLRVYLYVVWLTLLDFAGGAVAFALATALSLDGPLAGSYRPPQNQVGQSVIFAVVALIIAAVIGGPHYWLARRDMRSDPAHGGGGVRSFFLNYTLLGYGLTAIFASASTVSSFAYRSGNYWGGAAYPFAFAVVALVLFVLLELEHRRAVPNPGAPIVFRRLHLYAAPLIVVLFGLGMWATAVNATGNAVAIANKLASSCQDYGYSGPCLSAALNPVFNWGAVVVLALGVALYGLLARADGPSRIRATFHLIAVGYGAGLVAYGLGRLAELGTLAAQGQSVGLLDIIAPEYQFKPQTLAPLTYGLLVGGAFVWWLLREVPQAHMARPSVAAALYAVGAAVLAVSFWIGVGVLAYCTLRQVGGDSPQPGDWATGVGDIVGGVVWIPLALLLRLRARAEDAISGTVIARRLFVILNLAGGTITGAVGLAVMLYAIGTAQFGAQLQGWENIARGGAAALLVGATLALIYGWNARREHSFAAGIKPPSPATPDEVDAILDDLLAGRLARDAAAARLRQMVVAQR